MPSTVIYLLALQPLYLPKTAKPVMQKGLDWASVEMHQCEMEESSDMSLRPD